MQDPRPWTDNRQSTHAHRLPLCQTWLCFWRKKNAELCCRISPKEETMARLADYFTVVGYDPDKAGKLRCLWVEECCDLFRPLATTTARLLLLCFKRLIHGFHFLWRVSTVNGIKRECVSVLQLTLVVCVYELSSWSELSSWLGWCGPDAICMYNTAQANVFIIAYRIMCFCLIYECFSTIHGVNLSTHLLCLSRVHVNSAVTHAVACYNLSPSHTHWSLNGDLSALRCIDFHI